MILTINVSENTTPQHLASLLEVAAQYMGEGKKPKGNGDKGEWETKAAALPEHAGKKFLKVPGSWAGTREDYFKSIVEPATASGDDSDTSATLTDEDAL